MKRNACFVVRVMTSANALLLTTFVSWSQSISWIPLSTREAPYPTAVSSDGVVVGYFRDTDGYIKPFLWSRSNGFVRLNLSDGAREGLAHDISENGVIVGEAYFPSINNWKPARWQNNTLSIFYNDPGRAVGISADGSVMVGEAQFPNGWQAFRWTSNSGMQSIGTAAVTDVSGDGMVVVGYAQNENGVYRAHRWENGSWQELGPDSGDARDPRESFAEAVSGNGSVVVGYFNHDSERLDLVHAFRWTALNGMQDLGTLGGGSSYAWDVSTDGSIVVGLSEDASGNYRAFRWTPQRGMEDLNTVYASILNGSTLLEATGVSRNGRYIIGKGINSATGRAEAFVLDACVAHNGDVDASGCVDDADLLQVLFAFGSTGGDLGPVDVNCDNMVDDADLLIVLFNFGSGC